LFFAEVTYFEGAPDIYQLPLTLSTGAGAEQVTANRADSIITTFVSVGGMAILHDAAMQEDFQQLLLTLIASNTALALSTVFTPGLTGAASLAAPGDGGAGTTEASSTDTTRVGVHAMIAPTLPVAPAPLDAQPGEAAIASDSDNSPAVATPTQKMKPRESPSAGDAVIPRGRLEAHASSAFAEAHIPRRLPSRVGSAEQSNTSILYGDKLILKLFRRLQPGENPDVEIGRFLTEVAHFPRIAPYYGEISILPINGEKTTVAMLQGLVAHQGDGWEWYLKQLAGFYESIAALPLPPDLPAPTFSDMRTSIPEALQPGRLAIDAAALLGRRTAEMHQALSSRSDWPAFAPEPFTKEDLERDARRIEKQVSSALETLKSRLATLDDSTTDAAALLLSRRRELIARTRSIAMTVPAGLRIRIHGDYHLGQTLRTVGTPGDFVLLDFEGEPARPLEERRRKQSPLRDVAGMIRSFSYVAHAGLDRFLSAHRDGAQGVDREHMEAWARLWQNCASAEFLYAYRETIAGNEALLPPPEQAQTMLDAYLLEKALYELLYELNNRPSWLRIPIAGIVSL
jgi:maltose alpha-D-glucosyltransferase/alpha-amylase